MSTGNDEIVVALYDYTANDPEELSIRKNEQLVLLDAKFTWWKVRNGNGKLGLVPSNFLRRDKVKGESLVNRIAQKLPGAKRGKGGVNVGGGGGGRNVGAAHPFPSAGMANSNQINEEYVSKFNYDATRDDELTLTKGMKVLVLEMEGDGWWYGKHAERPGNPGWFPSNYVTKDTNNHPSNPPAFHESPKQQNGDCIMVVRALYPFNSGNAEELAFEQDEMLDIIEQPPEDPEWWMARNSEATTGLVPKNYVEAVPGAKSVMHPSYDPVCPNNISNSRPAINPVPVRNEPTGISGQISDQISDQPWFFGPIRRQEAELHLRNRAKNGEYLVRNCETAPGEFSISMKMPGRIRHFKVTVLPDGQYGIGQRKFDSLVSLLDHYKRAPIFTSAEQGKVYLTDPVQR